MGEWTDDRDVQLRAWRHQGFSYELIARKFTDLGFKRSKGSVIGRALRLGLINMMTKKPRYQIDNHARYKNPIASSAFVEKMMAARPSAADSLPTPTAGGEFLGLALIDLGAFDCRYPQGEGSHIRFCGQTQLAGSSYCEAHHKICNIKARMPAP